MPPTFTVKALAAGAVPVASRASSKVMTRVAWFTAGPVVVETTGAVMSRAVGPCTRCPVPWAMAVWVSVASVVPVLIALVPLACSRFAGMPIPVPESDSFTFDTT